MAKKITVRILLLALIVALSEFVYLNTTFDSDIRAEGNVLLKFRHGIETADALYFAASPNASVEQNDADKRTISQMMDDLVELKIEAVDTGGIHAGVFSKLIHLIPEESKVKTVIVEMNYRSFGLDWIHSKLENQIQKQMVFYNNRPAVINRFLQGLNYYETMPDKERDEIIQYHWKNDSLPFSPPRHTVTSWCSVEKWGDWTNPKRQLADQYIKNFAFLIDEQNPRIQDFDEIAETCKEKNLKLVFVILAENLDEAEQLVGRDLADLMISNKRFLVNRYTSKGAVVIDCFGDVRDSCFTERIFPSEHYNQTGRMIIASKVAVSLK